MARTICLYCEVDQTQEEHLEGCPMRIEKEIRTPAVVLASMELYEIGGRDRIAGIPAKLKDPSYQLGYNMGELT